MSEQDEKILRVKAIDHGTVIDHIPSSETLRVVQLVAHPDDEVVVGINFGSKHMSRKGVVKITGRELTKGEISKLALIAPGATMCIIRDYKVVDKTPVPVPAAFKGIGTCPNPNCITNHEPCPSNFEVTNEHPLRVRCHYCERSFDGVEVAGV